MVDPTNRRTLVGIAPTQGVPGPNMLAADNANPRGSNTAPLVENFEQRLRYKNASYFENLPRPIDTLYDKVFYGKVDRYQNVIVPKQDSTLLAQTSYEANIFAFDFVAEAFFQLQRNLTIAGDTGGIERIATVFYNLQPTRGWVNYNRIYQDYFQRLMEAYNAYLTSLDGAAFNKVVTLKDYVAQFINFLKTRIYFDRAPITLTEFVLFGGMTPCISGLALEVAEESYSEDIVKYEKYFLDPNFSYYVRAARKFGFYVDRNGPWRLFADVFSGPMAGPDGFIDKAGHVSGDIETNFFNTYYDRTYTLDLTLLKAYLRSAYNEFAQTYHQISETVSGLTKRGVSGAGVGSIACGAPTSISIVGYRHPASAADVENLGDPFWLEFYFNTRLLESGIGYNNAPVLIEEAVKIAHAYSYDEALIYINNLFKPYLYDERLFTKHLTQADAPVRVGSVLDVQGRFAAIGSSDY